MNRLETECESRRYHFHCNRHVISRFLSGFEARSVIDVNVEPLAYLVRRQRAFEWSRH
jgi:hypothetical protein